MGLSGTDTDADEAMLELLLLRRNGEAATLALLDPLALGLVLLLRLLELLFVVLLLALRWDSRNSDNQWQERTFSSSCVIVWKRSMWEGEGGASAHSYSRMVEGVHLHVLLRDKQYSVAVRAVRYIMLRMVM